MKYLIRGPRDPAEILALVDDFMGVPGKIAEHPEEVNFPASNALLHPFRLWTLLEDGSRKITDLATIFFYADWNDAASERILMADAEMEQAPHYISLKTHYGITTAAELTAKFHTLTALRPWKCPTSWGHRYIQEDALFRLKNYIDHLHTLGKPCPVMERCHAFFAGVGRVGACV